MQSSAKFINFALLYNFSLLLKQKQSNMTTEEKKYAEIGLSIENAVQSQMFGKPCFKINGKAFVCFFQNEMIFKLSDEAHSEALKLSKSHLFDPSGKGRPMKQWVQVPGGHMDKWPYFAIVALEYSSLSKQ